MAQDNELRRCQTPERDRETEQALSWCDLASGRTDHVYLDFHTAPELWQDFLLQMLLYVHRDRKDGELRTATSTSTLRLSSDWRLPLLRCLSHGNVWCRSSAGNGLEFGFGVSRGRPFSCHISNNKKWAFSVPKALTDFFHVWASALCTFYNNPAPLNGSMQFHYCTLVTWEPEQTTLLFWSAACGVTDATWPSHSRPAIAASARLFQICFSPLWHFDRLFVYLLFVYLVLFMH